MPRFFVAVLLTALLGGPTQAQSMGINIWGGGIKATPAQSARKAVEAMAREKCLYACVTEEGHALGWTEHTTILVLMLPQVEEDRTTAILFTAGRDQEAVRLRHALTSYLQNAPINPNAPEVYSSPDAFGKETRAPEVNWRLELREAFSTAKYLVPVASLVFEKRGFVTQNEAGKPFVLGAEMDRVGAVLLAPGPNGLKLFFASVAFSEEGKSCGRLCEQIHHETLKILTE